MTVRIVTDSGCDLAREICEPLGISIVPLSIRFGNEEFTDVIDLNPDQFYDKMAATGLLPETAAPSPGQFTKAFQDLAAQGADEVVCINLSRGLSATGQAADAGAREVADTIKVHNVDSQSVSMGHGTLVLRAAAAAADGADAESIVALIEELREPLRVYGVLDTLDNLKKGGRIGGAQAMLGTMLSIKPCLDLSSGVVEEAGRQRTRKKALGWLRSMLRDGAENVSVGHGNATDISNFLDDLAGLTNIDKVRVGKIGPVIGSHGGPGVIGLSFT